TYSQANTSTLDVLIKAFDYSNDHPEIDVLGDVNDVDRSVPNMNHHATPEPVHVYDFADGYINVLNDEKMVPNYSLDDMKLQHEEDNLTVEQRPVEHQPVDELIDVQKDKTTLLQENVKHQSNKPQYINVVKDDYKPPLASVFACAKSKTKKCGIRKNYVLRSIKERKKKLAMDLDSPFGQQGTTTLAPPKIRSMSSIEDIIVPLVFEENLSGPHDCERDKVTVPDDISKYLKMQEPPEYQFPWGFRDIVVGRIYWLTLACLEKAKKGWLQDCVSGTMPDYYSNSVRYLVPWRDVEKKQETMVENNEEKIATAAYLVSKRAWGFIEQWHIS
ncbi:hypothetical protein Tco_0576895, partial [Tanacetum coccineum]